VSSRAKVLRMKMQLIHNNVPCVWLSHCFSSDGYIINRIRDIYHYYSIVLMLYYLIFGSWLIVHAIVFSIYVLSCLSFYLFCIFANKDIHWGLWFLSLFIMDVWTLISVEMLSFAAPVMMSLISDALLDVWYHVMLMSIFLHSLERLCCFYSSCCLWEKVALVVPCCHCMKLMSLLVLFAHLDANK